MKATANEKKNYDKLISVLRICAIVFIFIMVGVLLFIMKKNNISVRNPGALLDMLHGSVLTTALMLIVINLVKSFAFVITPSVVFVVSGLVFEKLWVAILINFIATEIALIPTYYLGKLTGGAMIASLSNKFPKVKKVDDFAGQNEFMLSFLLKASGVIPGDLVSLILGAMNISFGKYFIGASIGALPINIMWAIFANKGDLNNPYTLLYLLPIIAFVLIMSLVVKKITKKKKDKNEAAPVSK